MKASWVSAWFPALAERRVRIYLFGQTVSVLGTWVLDITLNLLAWQLSQSPAVLGLLNFLLFGPGVVVTPLFASRLTPANARRRTLWVLAGATSVALALVLLQALDRLLLPALLTLAAARGVLNGMEVPSRQMLLTTDVSGPENLAGAVALNTVVFQLGRMTGPAFAGVLFVTLGALWAFGLAAAALLFMVATVMRLTRTPRAAAPVEAAGATGPGGLRGAWAFVRADRFGRLFLPTMICMGFFAGSYQTLVPVLADRVFGDAARWTGGFFAAVGGGALAGALLLSTRHMAMALRRMQVLLPWATALALAGLALSHHAALSVLCFAVVGFGMVSFSTGVNAVLHQRVPPQARGGLIALFLMSYMGAMPIAQPVAGALAQLLGVRAAFGTMAAALTVSLLWLFVPRWWAAGRLELDCHAL